MKNFDLKAMFENFIEYRFSHFKDKCLWYNLYTTNDIPFPFKIPVEELDGSFLYDIEKSKTSLMKWVKKAINEYNEING